MCGIQFFGIHRSILSAKDAFTHGCMETMAQTFWVRTCWACHDSLDIGRDISYCGSLLLPGIVLWLFGTVRSHPYNTWMDIVWKSTWAINVTRSLYQIRYYFFTFLIHTTSFFSHVFCPSFIFFLFHGLPRCFFYYYFHWSSCRIADHLEKAVSLISIGRKIVFHLGKRTSLEKPTSFLNQWP